MEAFEGLETSLDNGGEFKVLDWRKRVSMHCIFFTEIWSLLLHTHPDS